MGHFKDDKEHGSGKMTSGKGVVSNGMWNEGSLVGGSCLLS